MENEQEKMTRPNMCGICDFIMVHTPVYLTRYNSGRPNRNDNLWASPIVRLGFLSTRPRSQEFRGISKDGRQRRNSVWMLMTEKDGDTFYG